MNHSSHSASQPRKRRRGYSDLVLAGGVLVIMALMVLRLPVVLIDALVAVNITVGVGLLLIAIYIPTPVAFNSFPSVLLVSTLFRLALSVATTRLILLEGDAGHIIDAFGHFVAGGNLVVGLVVFVIITVVQFIVIAKGAERVAEVAARFTLDAMPGKQLSIDSDLRSGLIDQGEARARRSRLEQESQLNGALDGAMKFVKGDAIASIIIVIVNLVAGLTIGVVQREMAMGDAMAVYSILTIGDGMVAQIPALLGAMAAGLVVTRTSNEDGDRHLGETIGRQLFMQPTALLVTGGICVLLAAVPGFPSLVFLLLAAVLLAMAHVAAPGQLKKWLNAVQGRSEESDDLLDHNLPALTSERLAEPLTVALGPDLRPLLASTQALEHIQAVCDMLEDEMGVPLPAPALLAAEDLPGLGFSVSVFDVPAGHGLLQADTIRDGAIDVLLETLEDVCRRHADRFLGLQEVSELLESAATRYPAVVKDLLQAATGHTITQVLRNLVAEGIPIRNLRDILESLVEWGERERDPGTLTEFARVALKRYITAANADEQGMIQAIVLHPELEALLRSALRTTPAGITISLQPDAVSALRSNLQTLIETLSDVDPSKATASFVLLLSIDLRRHVRTLVQHDFPELPVLSYQELAMPVDILPLGQLTVPSHFFVDPLEEPAHVASAALPSPA